MSRSCPTVVFMGHSSDWEHFTYGYGIARVWAHAVTRGIRAEFFHYDRRAGDSLDEDVALIVDHRPDIVGLASYLWNSQRVAQLVAKLREALPNALIVLGGPSVLGYEEMANGGPFPDYLIVGEGEVPFANLLEAWQAGSLAEDENRIGSLVSFRTGRAVRYPDASPVTDLDSLGSPYLLGLSKPRGGVFYWETSRGCPYVCSFCTLSTKVNKMRYPSIGFLERELRWAMDNGLHDVNISDSALNNDTRRLDEFTAMTLRVDPEHRMMYTFALNSDFLRSDEQIRLLSRMRIKQCTLGLNSITPSTFKTTRRKMVPERFAEAVSRLATLTRPMVSVVMGLPGETVEGFRNTLDFCRTLEADVEIFELKVIPETTYYDSAQEFGLDYDLSRNMGVMQANSFTPADLDQMRTIATEFESDMGRWRYEHFVGETAHLSGGTVGRLRRALVAVGLLDASRPFILDNWRMHKLDVGGRQGVVTLHFENANLNETMKVRLETRTDRKRSFAHTMLFNLSYERPAPGRDASRAAIAFLERFHSLLVKAEQTCFEPPVYDLRPAAIEEERTIPGRKLAVLDSSR